MRAPGQREPGFARSRLRGEGATSMTDTNPIREGADVVDSDGERLGNVIAATPEYIVVEQGMFFPTDFYIPRNVIDKIEDAIVHLSITQTEAQDRGWSKKRSKPVPESEVAT